MIKYSYNGIVLPELPGGYDYAIISHQAATGRYYLLYSDQVFADINGQVVFMTTSQLKVYVTIPEAANWTLSGLNYDPNSGYTFTAVDYTTNLIWSNVNIIDLANSTSDNYVFAFSGSTPTQVIAADQPVADFGWYDGGEKGIDQITNITLVHGWQPGGRVAILAVAPDGGNVSVQWYKDDAVIMTENDGGSVCYSEYVPPTDTIGTYTLQCYCFNHYNGTVTGGITQIITVNVVAAPAFCLTSFQIGLANGFAIARSHFGETPIDSGLISAAGLDHTIGGDS